MSTPRTPIGDRRDGAAGRSELNEDADKSVGPSDLDSGAVRAQGAAMPDLEIHGSEFRNVRLPTFWRNRPKLWFAQLESEFVAYHIRADNVRYSAVVRHLDEAAMLVVADILEQPPVTGKYDALKGALIARFSDSQEKQLRTLLGELELGDKIPSALLREMRALAGKSVTDDVLKTLWVQRLPQRIQELLAVLEGVDLGQLAACADKALERSAGLSVAAVATLPQDDPIQRLTEVVEKLVIQVAAFEPQRSSRQRQRWRQRSRSRSKGRAQTKTPSDYCSFHRRFGDKAWRCIKPCAAPYPLATPENPGSRPQ